jgi:hypothetical protein
MQGPSPLLAWVTARGNDEMSWHNLTTIEGQFEDSDSKYEGVVDARQM